MLLSLPLLFSFNNLGKKVAPTHSGKKKVTSFKKVMKEGGPQFLSLTFYLQVK